MLPNNINRFEWQKAVIRSQLLPRAKTVAAALAVEFYNQKTGRLDPGCNAIVAATNLTPDTAKRAIRDLVEDGWLARTEGRGRGNKTQYFLRLPSKVIGVSTEDKKGLQSKKGRNSPPLTYKKGASVREKGGTGAPCYKDVKQTLEQRGLVAPSHKPEAVSVFMDHRFAGNPTKGPVVVDLSNQRMLDEYERFLSFHELPVLCSMPILQTNGDKYFAYLPYRKAPDTPEKTKEALNYFRGICEFMVAHREAI